MTAIFGTLLRMENEIISRSIFNILMPIRCMNRYDCASYIDYAMTYDLKDRCRTRYIGENDM